MIHSPPNDTYDEATRRHEIEQAKALRQQARAGGLRFEATKWFGSMAARPDRARGVRRSERSRAILLLTSPPALRLVPGGQRLQVWHPGKSGLGIG